MSSFFRKIAFGLTYNQKTPSDPLTWGINQIDHSLDLIWPNSLPTIEEQKDKWGEFRYTEDEILRKKYKDNRYLFEKELDKLRWKTGQKYFESFELNVRHFNALNSKTPIIDRLWHFWGNQFTISDTSNLPVYGTGPYLREIIRPRLGSTFEDLLINVTTSWAMMQHLDNKDNVGPNSKYAKRKKSERKNVGLNENHARELLELHSVSPNAKYSQEDVIETAKIMTGWYAKWTKKRDRTGPVKFNSEKHEYGEKKILGKLYNSEENKIAPNKQLLILLRDLAHHPKCIEHMSYRLCRHFITDEPTQSMMDPIIKTWKKNDGYLPEIHKTLIKVVFENKDTYRKLQMPETWFLQISKMMSLDYPTKPDQMKYDFKFRPMHHLRISEKTLNHIGHNPFRASQPNGFIDLEDEWLSPELMLRRLTLNDFLNHFMIKNAYSFDDLKEIIFSSINKNFDQIDDTTISLFNKISNKQEQGRNKLLLFFTNHPRILKA